MQAPWGGMVDATAGTLEDGPRQSDLGGSTDGKADHLGPGRRGARTSVLFLDPAQQAAVQAEPGYFSDLNLDQFVRSVTAEHEEQDLRPFFYEHLGAPDRVRYRQEVFEDLEDPGVLARVSAFLEGMSEVRACLRQAGKLRHRHQVESWFVEAVATYCAAVARLADGLAKEELGSRGLKELRRDLRGYVGSVAFTSLLSETEHVRQIISRVHYTVHINGGRVSVAKYDDEGDYSVEVLETFERFKQGVVQDYRVEFRDRPEMSQVEEKILTLVAELYPDVFGALDDYSARHRDFVDPTVQRFDREVQFFTAYVEYVAPLREAGLSFCYPEVTASSKEVYAESSFDLVLAHKLVGQGQAVVPNSFCLEGPERIMVVSGPNQGGKTTFARMFGQLHHLASLGCPVPGRRARLYLFDEIYTHFEREEDLSSMAGKLEDDLLRARALLLSATGRSVVVMNEPFTSTTLHDSLFLGTEVMRRLTELDVLATFVTFLDELASLGPSTVSMVSTVVPDNPAQRTFELVRRPADGLAYAQAVAEKYGLSYEALRKRVGP